jgi:FkbM family methyltransferase
MNYVGCNGDLSCTDSLNYENTNNLILDNQHSLQSNIVDPVEQAKVIDRCNGQQNTKATIFDLYNVEESEKQELKALSKAQLKQDIFAYLESDRKNNGFFVEFGATNGISLSNSYMLEQNFAWKGILAEPAFMWHKALKINRPDSYIETSCVWKESGHKLMFNQVDVLSTIDLYSNKDYHSTRRENGERYEVETISLSDLLKKYHAPNIIDYLSIDTEGSELDILEAFFKSNDEYQIKIITCEHNHTPYRQKIYELLTTYGYERINKCISQWDDFYVLQRQ